MSKYKWACSFWNKLVCKSVSSAPENNFPEWVAPGKWICNINTMRFYKVESLSFGKIDATLAGTGNTYQLDCLSELREAKLVPWYYCYAPAILKITNEKYLDSDVVILDPDDTYSVKYTSRRYSRTVTIEELISDGWEQMNLMPLGDLYYKDSNGDWVHPFTEAEYMEHEKYWGQGEQ